MAADEEAREKEKRGGRGVVRETERESVWRTCERENTCELNRAGFLWVRDSDVSMIGGG